MSAWDGYIYVAKRWGYDTYKAEAIKIGYSRDPIRRVKELDQATDGEVDLVGFFPGSLELEKELHKQFADERISGEWYTASPGSHADIFAATVDVLHGSYLHNTKLLEPVQVDGRVTMAQRIADEEKHFDAEVVRELHVMKHELAIPNRKYLELLRKLRAEIDSWRLSVYEQVYGIGVAIKNHNASASFIRGCALNSGCRL